MCSILGVLEGFSPLWCNFCNNSGINYKLSIVEVLVFSFFCWQGNSLGGQFWVMGKFNLLDGQNYLLDGQISIQLTCHYLPGLKWHWRPF